MDTESTVRRGASIDLGESVDSSVAMYGRLPDCGECERAISITAGSPPCLAGRYKARKRIVVVYFGTPANEYSEAMLGAPAGMA
jgi:hypothetical protein